jgi:hypothetical protein
MSERRMVNRRRRSILGFARAKGELFALLGGVNLSMPGKLAWVLQEFEMDPRLVMVNHKYWFRDPREDWAWELGILLVAGDVPADRQKLLEYVAAPTSSPVLRWEAVERIGMWQESASVN